MNDVITIGGADEPTAIMLTATCPIWLYFLITAGIVVAGTALVFGLMRLFKKK